MKLKLIEKRDEAEGTKSFFWLPEETVTYLPGQYFYYTLPKLNYSDDRGPTRHFTISSSPAETRLLRLTTRMRGSGFKKTLDELPVGSEINGSGPNGTFVFDETDMSTHIFLAGGIGITTFRSMINYNLVSNFNVPVYLFYSNSDENKVVFGNELTQWDNTYENFTMEQIITGREGHVNEVKLRTFLENCNNRSLKALELAKCTWWICGPPGYVDTMEELLGILKIDADQIHSEKFTGY